MRTNRPGSSTGRWTSFPSLLDGDVPFYSHEIDAYWNDIGSVGEFVQGNLDALSGQVRIAPPAEEVSSGVYAGDGSDLDAVKVKAPVLIGRELPARRRADLHGPVVVGDGCRIGPGAMLRDASCFPGLRSRQAPWLSAASTASRPIARSASRGRRPTSGPRPERHLCPSSLFDPVRWSCT